MVIRTDSFTSTAGNAGSIAAGARCLSGERAVSGGHTLTVGYPDDALVADEPLPGTAGATPTGWYVNYTVLAHPSRTLTVFAICARP